MTRKRGNGEGSIYPVRGKDDKVKGYRAAYAVHIADGPKRRYISGKKQDVGHGDVGALGGEGLHDTAPYPPHPPGHDGDLALQPAHQASGLGSGGVVAAAAKATAWERATAPTASAGGRNRGWWSGTSGVFGAPPMPTKSMSVGATRP